MRNEYYYTSSMCTACGTTSINLSFRMTKFKLGFLSADEQSGIPLNISVLQVSDIFDIVQWS